MVCPSPNPQEHDNIVVAAAQVKKLQAQPVVVEGLGFRGLGFRGLGFRGLGAVGFGLLL